MMQTASEWISGSRINLFPCHSRDSSVVDSGVAFVHPSVSVAELQSHPELDPDSDGTLTEAEAQVRHPVAFYLFSSLWVPGNTFHLTTGCQHSFHSGFDFVFFHSCPNRV